MNRARPMAARLISRTIAFHSTKYSGFKFRIFHLKDSISGWGKNCELLASRCQLHVVFRWGQRYNLSHCSYSSYLRRNLNRVRDYFIFLTSSRVTLEWRDKLVSCSQSRVCHYFLREFGKGKVPFSPPFPDSSVFFFSRILFLLPHPVLFNSGCARASWIFVHFAFLFLDLPKIHM